MDFYIRHSLSGRLRVRYDKKQISVRQATLAQSLLSVQEGMISVDVNYIVGSFLIYYDATRLSENEIVAFFKALTSKYLNDEEMLNSVIIPPKQDSLLQVLGFMVANHYLKMLLPAPLKVLFRTFNLCPRILKGVHQILKSNWFKADVLDASAITVALITGDTRTASNINFLLNIGETIEEFTKKKSYNDLAGVMLSGNNQVQFVEGNIERTVPLYTIKSGDMVVARTGSVIPVDGMVLRGEALVNQATITGEPIAVEKRENTTVYAGTILQEGELYIKVLAVGGQTKVQNILSMIDNSQELKVSSQIRSERLSDTLVKYNFILSALTFIFTRNITKVMATLMVDYSCAMKLAAPIAVLSAMKESASHGILVKGGKFLENASMADTIVFDKTGTLTNASPELSRIILCSKEINEEKALQLAACLEEHFAHPVANAIVKAAKEKNLDHPEEHAKVEYIVAHGIASSIKGKRILLGSKHFVFEDENVKQPVNLEEIQKDALEKGESLLYLAEEDSLLAIFSVTDPVRENAKEVIKKLHDSGVKNCVMITGDDEGAAKTAAAATNIDCYFSNALPEDKLNYIKNQQSKGHKVIMIGDGINDAPALAAADTGIAMGGSAEITGESADIVLSEKDGLEGLYKTRVLGKRLIEKINRNNRHIIGVNSALIAFGLFGWISPYWAAVLHNTSTIFISVKAMQPLLNEDTEGSQQCK